MIDERWLLDRDWQYLYTQEDNSTLWYHSLLDGIVYYSSISQRYIWLGIKAHTWFVKKEDKFHHIPSGNVFNSFSEVVAYIEMMQ